MSTVEPGFSAILRQRPSNYGYVGCSSVVANHLVVPCNILPVHATPAVESHAVGLRCALDVAEGVHLLVTFQVVLAGIRLLADGALEGALARVSPLVECQVGRVVRAVAAVLAVVPLVSCQLSKTVLSCIHW